MLFVAGTDVRLIRTFRQRSFSCLPWHRPKGCAITRIVAPAERNGSDSSRARFPTTQVAPHARIADLAETMSLVDASKPVKEALGMIFAASMSGGWLGGTYIPDENETKAKGTCSCVPLRFTPEGSSITHGIPRSRR
jgi:hypothetical protein